MVSSDHYLNKLQPSSMIPYRVTRSQWMNSTKFYDTIQGHQATMNEFNQVLWYHTGSPGHNEWIQPSSLITYRVTRSQWMNSIKFYDTIQGHQVTMNEFNQVLWYHTGSPGHNEWIQSSSMIPYGVTKSQWMNSIKFYDTIQGHQVTMNEFNQVLWYHTGSPGQNELIQSSSMIPYRVTRSQWMNSIKSPGEKYHRNSILGNNNQSITHSPIPHHYLPGVLQKTNGPICNILPPWMLYEKSLFIMVFYWQYISLGSGNDLVTNRWQASSWTNVVQSCTRPEWVNQLFNPAIPNHYLRSVFQKTNGPLSNIWPSWMVYELPQSKVMGCFASPNTATVN